MCVCEGVGLGVLVLGTPILEWEKSGDRLQLPRGLCVGGTVMGDRVSLPGLGLTGASLPPINPS